MYISEEKTLHNNHNNNDLNFQVCEYFLHSMTLVPIGLSIIVNYYVYIYIHVYTRIYIYNYSDIHTYLSVMKTMVDV